ncbi:MAG: methionine--tRNA ligase [Bacteroidetes bacterium]|nr:methionine--tRNA ligase [Bacteroidota bacterium]MBP7398288.1 methionine--tRNA ligase [Chitinophagales bacterium]MBK8488958.1 methionine--tRNA ligase [Bacteroidota bacterium]MBK8680806.1 methionine--tRNA ligase [Bacteroidota bacterium]MBP8753596.1 methionine--tRNA ligase [Chitinophagales bacterium]
MTQPQRYLITSALPYANGPLHVGHIAGAYLPADIYVRYLRRRKQDVVFVCGSDEHGVAITIQAKKEGITPKEIIDKYHTINKKAFEDLGISFDIYHRTSSELHHQTSSDFFLELYNKGVFEEKESEQYYDEKFHQFLADRYIQGTCPNCANPNAYGDQCEKCGTSLNADDLINPVSTLSGEKPSKKKTKHWYLPLNNYQQWLTDWIVQGEGRKEEWKRNVLGQCKSWLDDGLHPRPITRDLDWGVKVPLPGADGKVLYVWLDAPIGYISATKQWAKDHNKNWEPYWKDETTKLVHFIGKDNIVFHCLIFPVILKSHGGFILPTNVPANEFMNLEGDKMSTSRNWSVQVHTFLNDNPGKEDVLRYVLSSNLPETKDSEFSWKDYQAKNNNELVAILGNFINRVLVLTHKFFDGKVPEINKEFLQEEYIQNYYSTINRLIEKNYKPAIESYRFRDAMAAMMDVVRTGNKLLTDYEPWKIFKQDPDTCAGVLRICLESLIDIAVLCEPFLPFTATKIYNTLSVNEESLSFQFNNIQLVTGNRVSEPVHFFNKIDEAEIIAKIEALQKGKTTSIISEVIKEETNLKPTIAFDDFAKLDLRTGTIIHAEAIPKADKLLNLTVDLGFEKCTIASGIAKHFTPESIIGAKVVVLVNLAPRSMRGVESNGMILMAKDKEGKLYFVQATDLDQDGAIVS